MGCSASQEGKEEENKAEKELEQIQVMLAHEGTGAVPCMCHTNLGTGTDPGKYSTHWRTGTVPGIC
jgi:hypothetical protein